MTDKTTARKKLQVTNKKYRENYDRIFEPKWVQPRVMVDVEELKKRYPPKLTKEEIIERCRKMDGSVDHIRLNALCSENNYGWISYLAYDPKYDVKFQNRDLLFSSGSIY